MDATIEDKPTVSNQDSGSSLECHDGGGVAVDRAARNDPHHAAVVPPSTDNPHVIAAVEPPPRAAVTVIEPHALLLSLSVLQSRVSHLQALLGMLAQPSCVLKVQDAPYEQAAVAVGTMIQQLAVAAVSLLPPAHQATMLQTEPLLQPAGAANAADAAGIVAAANGATAPGTAISSVSPESKADASRETAAEPGEPRHEPVGEEARASQAAPVTTGGPAVETQTVTAVVGRKRGRDDAWDEKPVEGSCAGGACYNVESGRRGNPSNQLPPPGVGVMTIAEQSHLEGAMEAGDEEEKAVEEDCMAPARANPWGSSNGSASEVFSCPANGCPFNEQHPSFRPLKSKASLRNHYRRAHSPHPLLCSQCGSKSFCLPADLEAHKRRCGPRRWHCSCGNSFSRKDKLTNHFKAFPSHHELATQSTLLPAPSNVQQAPQVEESGPSNAIPVAGDTPAVDPGPTDRLPYYHHRNSMVQGQDGYDTAACANLHPTPASVDSIHVPSTGPLYRDAVNAAEALAESFRHSSKDYLDYASIREKDSLHFREEMEQPHAVESTFSIVELFPELSC
ncbi:hypothetical protein CLOM_g13424 [Closterium sp. NIES-68]|nr:hypothetical protein CLOM_g13424 [Closterium sp. NIES-68]GJP72438.1 hypothetical protein CLOP_g3170 [Closterium sp. NIES-67]